MIRLPFHRAGFEKEMKPLISGMNLSLEYDNIESSLAKTAVELVNILSQPLYDRLLDAFEAGTPPEPDRTAINYLQRGMLHFAIYEHLIFIITQVSNDGVTVKKTDTETTAYKYQTDELNNKLISTAWFWINQLIAWLDQHIADFPEWAGSAQKKDYDSLPVTLSDFTKFVGVSTTGGEYFLMYVAWLIREVWTDCVLSRLKDPVKTDKIARAVCYEVMGRACHILAYPCLPEPIRKDIDNEMGKNHLAQADRLIREHVAQRFIARAAVYWEAVDLEIKQAAIVAGKASRLSSPILGKTGSRDSDKFCFS
jgi:hypothetical protein